MSLIIVGENSYVTLAEAREFLATRSLTLTGNDEQDEQLLLIGADYLESKGEFPTYIGQRADLEQPLHWPRSGASVDGVALDPLVVPTAIIKAQCYAAYEANNEDLWVNRSGERILRERVDVIETQYSNSSSISAQPIFGRVEMCLRPYYGLGYNLRTLRI